MTFYVLYVYRAAYDVTLSDDSWPEEAFDVIDGKTSNSWERLDVLVTYIITSDLCVKLNISCTL